MERDSLKHSEFNLPSKSVETTSSTETDKKKNKKTQSDNERVWSRINSSEAKNDETKPKPAESLNTLWRRTIEEAKKEDTKEQPPAEESISGDQLEHLSQAEVKEVAEAYLTARRQEIAQELTGDIDEQATEIDEQAALAADTYLASVENKLRTEPDVNIMDVTDQAYHEAVLSYAPESSLVTPPEDELSYPGGEEPPQLLSESLDNQRSGAGGGEIGREPPQSRDDAFSPERRYSFGTSSTNTPGTLETVIERDFAAERVAAVRGLLVGGIIGYLIGRRRGRIKTEKRLIPIQKKLEREVSSLYTTISIKETQLRKLVSERDHSLKFTITETTSEATHPRYASESFPINQKQTNPETLNPPKLHSAEVINPPSSKLEVVNRENLLVAGEKITVGSTNLRKVFETGLISERGLRRAVEEYAKGGDIRRVLAEEVLIKELGYELDPLMRDRPLRRVTAPLASSAAQQASHEQAAAVVSGRADAPSLDIDSFPPAPPVPVSQRSVPPQLIIANVTALIVLTVLLLILLITHK